MIFKETNLKGNFLIDLEPITDERGFFARYFGEKEFSSAKLNAQWVQINNSMSCDVGTLRGLHFQRPPHAEVKLVRCVRGSIWDVVVDLRKGSDSYGKWFGTKLSDENRTMMYVPKGFAHGFVSLEADSEILYRVSDFYVPEAEGTLNWDDPDVDILWPIQPQIISDKDLQGRLLRDISPIEVE